MIINTNRKIVLNINLFKKGGDIMGGHNKGLHQIAWILLIIGGLNWLLFGLFKWDVGSLLGGMDGTAATIIYVLVGLSALYELFTHKGRCKDCAASGGAMS